MTPVTVCAGKTLALFGLGGSGLATAQALVAGGARVLAWDDAPAARQGASDLGIEVADLRTVDWSSVSSLVLSPGVPLTHPEPHWSAARARAAGIEVIGDIELFCRERAGISPASPLVAITGTNGKSTTTALASHILRTAGWDVQMGGNIGTAILALASPAPDRAHVIEVSSYQIDLAPSLHVSIGALLNVTPDHLDRHGSIENYAAVKERIVVGAEWSLAGVDDLYGSAISERAGRREAEATPARPPPGRHYPVSVERRLDHGISLDGTRIVLRIEGSPHRILGDVGGLTALRGRHNAQNGCFAAGIAALLAVSSTDIQLGLASFPGLPHRMEEIGRPHGTLFINDSKATNAESTEKALLSFSRVFWILGGKPKDGGIAGLKPHFPRIERAYLIGQATEDFAATLEGRASYERCGTLETAVAQAAADARASDLSEKVVLFSPACASFDQFKNFEERGDRFRALVRALES